MSKCISSQKLTPTLSLSRCNDGFWLYDTTRGMNLSIRAKTETEAFVDALGYYQKRLGEVERAYKCLQNKVDNFVSQFVEEEELDEYRS